MEKIGHTIGMVSLAAILIFGSALDSVSVIPVIGCAVALFGLFIAELLAGVLR